MKKQQGERGVGWGRLESVVSQKLSKENVQRKRE